MSRKREESEMPAQSMEEIIAKLPTHTMKQEKR